MEDASWTFQYHCLVWLDRFLVAGQQAANSERILLYERLLKSWIDLNGAEILRAIIRGSMWPSECVPPFYEKRSNTLSRGMADWRFLGPYSYAGKANHHLRQDNGLLAIATSSKDLPRSVLAQGRIQMMLGDAVDKEGAGQKFQDLHLGAPLRVAPSETHPDWLMVMFRRTGDASIWRALDTGVAITVDAAAVWLGTAPLWLSYGFKGTSMRTQKRH